MKTINLPDCEIGDSIWSVCVRDKNWSVYKETVAAFVVDETGVYPAFDTVDEGLGVIYEWYKTRNEAVSVAMKNGLPEAKHF